MKKLQAISFELIKKAILHFYESYPKQKGTVHIDKDLDQKGRVVSLIIRVSDSEIHVYTLCVYYTRCSFLVNGKKVEKFMDDDLPAIHDMLKEVVLDGKPVDLKALNKALELQLNKLLNAKQKPNIQSNLVNQLAITSGKKDIACIKCAKKRNIL